jgi:isoleucyl-tRNA synthetase
VQRLQTYCSEDLGGFYLDVLKDRLYTSTRESRARRSAQTALATIRDLLLKLMSPVLSFTAEEAWAIVHPADPSVFCHTWTDALPPVPDADALSDKWGRILAVRAAVLKLLEENRQNKGDPTGGGLGSSLEAEVDIATSGQELDDLASLGDDLKFVLIVSAASARALPQATPDSARRIAVTKTSQPKCERCWHRRADVGAAAAHPTLCGRCLENLAGPGEARRFA